VNVLSDLRSGISALLACVHAEGIGAGDEVITSAYGSFTIAGAIARSGAVPVFVDIDPATFNIAPSQIVAAITSRTRAVVPMHLFGQMADMEAVMQIAQAYGLVVIEEAGQAVGAEHKGRRAGTIGHYACYSSAPDALSVANDAAIAARQRNARRYHQLLDRSSAACQSPRAGLPAVVTDRHVFTQYVVRVGDRDAVRAAMETLGIELEDGPSAMPGSFPEATRAARETLSLPVHPEMTDERIRLVADCLCRCLLDQAADRSKTAA
jgi:dTDP-4-amino-4,6-dideoxygalactose transaminase